MSLLALAFAALGSPPLTATDDGPVYGVGTGTVTTTPVTITAVGGTPPYTYSAAYLSGDSATILNGTTNAPSFRKTSVGIFDIFSGVVRVTVTDAALTTVNRDVTWQISGS